MNDNLWIYMTKRVYLVCKKFKRQNGGGGGNECYAVKNLYKLNVFHCCGVNLFLFVCYKGPYFFKSISKK